MKRRNFFATMSGLAAGLFVSSNAVAKESWTTAEWVDSKEYSDNSELFDEKDIVYKKEAINAIPNDQELFSKVMTEFNKMEKLNTLS